MVRNFILLCLGIWSIHNLVFADQIMKSDELEIQMNNFGQIEQFSVLGMPVADGKSELLQLKRDGEILSPVAAKFENNEILLSFPEGFEAKIRVAEKNSHILLELTDFSPLDEVDAVIWGPYRLNMDDKIGEFVGVVQEGGLAAGIQSLNVKTVGGFPINDEGAIFSRGITAEKTETGSQLQAFSLNRHKPRKIDVWGEWGPTFINMPVEPIANETVIGSKIALFACSDTQALDRIGEIEVAEGLPHPLYEGQWLKKHPEAGKAYMITYFSEENFDKMLHWAKLGGFTRMYHEGPFESWGNFKLNSEAFPNGYNGMKSCVEKAKSNNIMLGTHFLSNFITTNDEYVTPNPNDRLAVAGFSELVNDIDKNQNTLPVQSNDYFKLKSDWMHTVMVGDELVRYQKVTENPPYELVNCQRGAFGTQPSIHKKGSLVKKLVDHPYKVFYPDFKLQQEIADNIIHYLNYTGVEQIDFDGHEGCYSTGQGDYSMDYFAKQVYDGVKQNFINGSSRSNHYYWHIVTYLNWGEPWYGGFRESQLDYRLKNQELLERNFLPNMLGWFLFTENSSVQDIEWMMARAAGFDAGFAFVIRQQALENNPLTEELLALVKTWEDARLQKIFSREQREQMKNPDNEFHLEKVSEIQWKLYPYNHYTFEHENKILQPGQPTFSEFNFETKDQNQPLNLSLTLKSEDNELSNIYFELDYNRYPLPLGLKDGETLLLDSDNMLKKYDNKGRMIDKIQWNSEIWRMDSGSHLLQIDGQFKNTHAGVVMIKIKTMAQPVIIEKK